jgi:hypothetical protein
MTDQKSKSKSKSIKAICCKSPQEYLLDENKVGHKLTLFDVCDCGVKVNLHRCLDKVEVKESKVADDKVVDEKDGSSKVLRKAKLEALKILRLQPGVLSCNRCNRCNRIWSRVQMSSYRYSPQYSNWKV